MTANLAIVQFEVKKAVTISELVSNHSELFDYSAHVLLREGFARTKSKTGAFLITKANNALADSFEKPWRACTAVEIVLAYLQTASANSAQLFDVGCEFATSDEMFLVCHLGGRALSIIVHIDLHGKIGFRADSINSGGVPESLKLQNV